MTADVLSTKVTEGIAVITLGSAKRMYFDAEMGDALTERLQEFAGDPNIRNSGSGCIQAVEAQSAFPIWWDAGGPSKSF